MYSEWYKIDFHIHTNKSNETKNNDYTGSYDWNVLKKSLEDNSIDMISLTDHNIVNVDAYNELKNDDFPHLLGIELDIALTNKDLVKYIDEVADPQKNNKINIKPFHILQLFETQEYKKISDILDDMYKKISKELFSNIKIDLYSNKFLRVTTFEYLANAFKDYNYFIVAHGNKDKGLIPPFLKSGKLEEAQYEILLGGISALEMKSQITIKNTINNYNENFDKLSKEDFTGVDPTSYVVFSDNHNCSAYETRSLSTWMKGATNYETLRLSFSDPESRIHTSEVPPSSVPHYIDELEIKLKKGNTQKIQFSPYLNVIIGGRSSGKSLLFNTLQNLNTGLRNRNIKLYTDVYSKFIDEVKIKTNMTSNYGEMNLVGEAYQQEKIIELFKNNSELKDSLKDLFPNFSSEETKEKEIEIVSIFETLSTSYEDYFNQVGKLEKGDFKTHICNSIQTIEKLFSINETVLNSDINTDEHDHVLTELNNAILQLRSAKELKINKIGLFSEEELASINSTIEILVDKKVSVIKIKNKLLIRNSFFKKVKKIVDNYNHDELDSEKHKVEFSKIKIDEFLNDYKSYFVSKLKLKEISELLEVAVIPETIKVEETDKYKFISKLNLCINGDIVIEELLEHYILNYDSKVSIYKNLCKMADPNSKLRIKKETENGKLPNIFKSKVKSFLNTKNNSVANYEIEEKHGAYVNSSTTSQGKKASMFLDIKLDVLRNVNSDEILLIDQIEDNIDNKYISMELVKQIRDLKKRTQIIFVTHNPSIAIFGDAENIIIAENDITGIKYKYGGLENVEIREDACKILDGGNIAFKNRMGKYDITKIK